MSRRTLPPIIAVATALLLFAGWFLVPHSATAAAASAQVTLTGTDGKTVSLGDYSDRPVVLNFWAVWCPPCLMEIPTFSSFATSNPDVAVLGIAVDSGSTAELPQIKKQLGISYPVFSADQSVMAAFGVRGLPTTVILQPGGEISTIHTGMMSRHDLEQAVAQVQ